MTPQDALRVLGLGVNATPDTIKSTWKRMAASLHPDRYSGEEQVTKSAQLSEVNAAWSVLKTLTTPLAQQTVKRLEFGVSYIARDPVVADAIHKLARQDARRVRRAWWGTFWSGVWRGRLPQRMSPLSVVLCSAVVQEGTHLSILFEAPLPKGRSAVLIPTIKPGSGDVRVYPDRPLVVHSEHLLQSTRSLFEPQELTRMGVDRVDVVFPSRTLNITKTVRVLPSQGLDRLYYRL